MPQQYSNQTATQVEKEKTSLAAAGSEGMTMLKTLAEKMGAAAAMNKIRTSQASAGMGGDGQSMRANIPGIPAPIFAGNQMAPNELSLEGGGNTNWGLRVSHDRTRLVNFLGKAADVALANKKEKDMAVKQREYEILIAAYKGINSSDPAIREHNANIINHFFEGKEGEKRAKELGKALGFDAFDVKNEQKKQADPSYQAVQGALSKSQQVPSSQDPNEAALMEATGGYAETPKRNVQGTQNLNPTAQKFFGNMPMNQGPLEYSPGPEDVKQAWLVANKIGVSADEKLKAVSSLIQEDNKFILEAFKAANTKEIEGMKQRVELLKQTMGDEKAWAVAALESNDKRLDREVSKARLLFDAGKADFDQKKDAVINIRNASINRAENLLKKLNYLNSNLKTFLGTSKSQEQVTIKDKDGNEIKMGVIDKEIAETKDALADAQSSIDESFRMEADLYGKEKGVALRPHGREGNAATAVENFDKSNGSGPREEVKPKSKGKGRFDRIIDQLVPREPL